MSFSLSSKIMNIVNKLPDYAIKSPLSQQHAAVLIKNGVPLAWSYNNIRGTKTYHAECDVVRRYCKKTPRQEEYCIL